MPALAGMAMSRLISALQPAMALSGSLLLQSRDWLKAGIADSVSTAAGKIARYPLMIAIAASLDRRLRLICGQIRANCLRTHRPADSKRPADSPPACLFNRETSLFRRQVIKPAGGV